MLDQQITNQHVKNIDYRDAVADFFDYLGYDVQNRTVQTPENLGISAEKLKHVIIHIEEIANQQDMLRVLLVELKSVTVAHTRTLINNLRHLASDFLLVLTDDYERIDFVLLERIQPDGGSKGPSSKNVKARPRVLTVDRLNPDKIALRVLRRLTYTGSDPLAQYDKLLGAFETAEWSEEHFDNRALFSDYCLKERVPDMPEWNEDIRTCFYELQEIYNTAYGKENYNSDRYEELIKPVFEKLGYSMEQKPLENGANGSYYVLYGHNNGQEKIGPLCLCLPYCFGRSLDAKDPRDQNTPDQNPAFQVVSLLRTGNIPFAIVTNGSLWRLYTTKTHSMATRFYQVDLPEILAGDDVSVAFRYFYLFFRSHAFTSERKDKDAGCFIERVLKQSRNYAKKLEDQLKERVFERIFPHFARGFINSICTRTRRNALDLSESELDTVYEATLSFLYRLLFLLYAESRNMMPVGEKRGYYNISLSKLKKEIASNGGDLQDKEQSKLESAYSEDGTELYQRLMRLFEVIDEGAHQYNVPTYNGGLFVTKPDKNDNSEEAITAAFIAENTISDRHLALGLDQMTRDLDDKTFQLVFIDYKSLGVRQLGSIYEGLLEFKVRVAETNLCIVKEKNTYRYKPKGELTKKQLDKLKSARATTVSYGPKKGEVYLENDKGERKASGSYYTPEYIVDYIVKHTVGPVMEKKLQPLRSELREAEKTYSKLKTGVGVREDYSNAYAVGEAFEKHSSTVDRMFDIKVLDPAMGSGHFLVEAIDFITHRLIEFLNAFPWNPVTELLEKTRRTIMEEMDEQGISIDPEHLNDVNLMKRHVMKRCIYGVDMNPMAVELAKVSLWLDCFTLGAPLSFLDHHLRCGNSLVGTEVKAVQKSMERHGKDKTQLSMFASIFTGLEKASDTMVRVGELTDTTVDQVRMSVQHYKTAEIMLQPYKAMLDVWVSEWFGNERAQREARIYRTALFEAVRAMVNGHKQPAGVPDSVWNVVRKASDISQQQRFFHWELEFPEVWRNKNRSEGKSGFDVVIGNPPYGLIQNKPVSVFLSETGQIGDTHSNMAAFFISRVTQLQEGHSCGFIVPKSFTYSDGWQRVRNLLLPGLYQIIDASKAFKEVLLEQIILLWEPGSEKTYYYQGIIRPNKMELSSLSKDKLSQVKGLLTGLSVWEIDFISDVLRNMHFSDGKLHNVRGKGVQRVTAREEEVPVIEGRTIGCYYLRPYKKFISNDVVTKNFNSYQLSKRVVAQNIVAHISQPLPHSRIIAAIAPKGTASLDTVNNLDASELGLTPEMLCALLNSRFINWWLYRVGYNQAIRTMHFDAPYSSLIPIPKKVDFLQKVGELVTELNEDNTDFVESCEAIDSYVFEAYEVEEEIMLRIKDQTWSTLDWRCGNG